MTRLTLTALFLAQTVLAGLPALAQEAAPAAAPAPGAAQPFAAEAPAPRTGFDGYVQSQPRGMGTGGSSVPAATEFPMTSPEGLPPIATGQEISEDKIEGFNEAIDKVFPMTPDMIRQYIEIQRQSEAAMLERPEPEATSDTVLVSLEPGEATPILKVAGGIASVVGIYDSTGQPWPVVQYVIGSGEDFQVIQLGEKANSLTVTPLVPVGWTNLVVMLEGEPKPLMMSLEVSDTVVNDRRDVQVMRPGPNAQVTTAAPDTITEAGDATLMAAVSGVDLPAEALPVAVTGVDARAWLMGDTVLLRSRHALLSPSWSASMQGPDGVRVYQIPRSSFALFSVDGQIVRADITLP